MRELAILAGCAIKPSVEELAGKVVVHVEALIPLGAAVHQVELAKLHLPRWKSVVREGTVVAPMALALHVVHAYRVRVLKVVVPLVASAVALVAQLRPRLVLATALVLHAAPTTSYDGKFFIALLL